MSYTQSPSFRRSNGIWSGFLTPPRQVCLIDRPPRSLLFKSVLRRHWLYSMCVVQELHFSLQFIHSVTLPSKPIHVYDSRRLVSTLCCQMYTRPLTGPTGKNYSDRPDRLRLNPTYFIRLVLFCPSVRSRSITLFDIFENTKFRFSAENDSKRSEMLLLW